MQKEHNMESIIYVGMDVHKDSYSICCYKSNEDKYYYEKKIIAESKRVIRYLESVKKLHSLALEQKEDAKHGEAFFPVQKYVTRLAADYPVVTTHCRGGRNFRKKIHTQCVESGRSYIGKR